MLPLPELQQTFADWVLRGGSQNRMSACIKADGLTAEQRLSVYRNNTQLGLTEALRECYPVVNKLVGTDFFNQLARNYIRQHPPKAGCLLTFGREFADFIGGYQPAAGLPYLPDVARLEWYWHEAFHEADGIAITVDTLKHIKQDQYADFSLQVQPSVRLLAFVYPVLPIWQGNQDDSPNDGLIDLGQGGNRVLIYRPILEVLMLPLAEAEYQCLLAIRQGLPLAQAVTEAFNTDNAFDLSAALQRWFACGLFTGYTTTKNQEFSS